MKTLVTWLVMILFSVSLLNNSVFGIKIPIGLGPYDSDKLPVYCDKSTGYFECKLSETKTLCLAMSMKCQKEINCLNVNCAQNCTADQYECKKSASDKKTHECISNEWLCDGRNDCPLGDDEHVEMCKSRKCEPNQFACQSRGHCIDISKRCNGKQDCWREGFQDLSDEANCVDKAVLSATSACDSPGSFQCRDKSKCIRKEYSCDGFRDCDDNSDEDELNCPKQNCDSSQFMCDGKCLDMSKKCDNVRDCSQGEDERGCKHHQCPFSSQKYCPISEKCISDSFVCDGSSDCKFGEDETCPINHYICKSDDYWTCKDGKFCIMDKFKCDGKQQCLDGSDEYDCPTKAPKLAPVCPPNLHECNGSSVCVNIADVCKGSVKCPHPDSYVEAVCVNIHKEKSPCSKNNGGCEQLCDSTVVNGHLASKCSCRGGYQISKPDPSKCEDIDECKLFGKCSQLCRNTIGSFECSCSNGYLLKNGTSCEAPGSYKILMSSGTSLSMFDKDTRKTIGITATPDVIKYIDYDFSTKQVFYHSRSGQIGYYYANNYNSGSASPSSTAADRKGGVFLTNMEVDTIAYDWVNKLLFYVTPSIPTRKIIGSIGVLDVKTNKSVELRKLQCPRGLAVHPGLGYLYVSMFCDTEPGIYRMNFDGRQLVKIVDTKVKRPGHLALDLSQKVPRLYWVDSGLRGIYSSDLDGKDLRAVWHMERQYEGNAYDLNVFEDRIFWNDMSLGTVYSINKFTGLNLTEVVSLRKYNGIITSVNVMHEFKQPPMKQYCHTNTCEQICLLSSSNSITCLCDKYHKIAADNRKCVPLSSIDEKDYRNPSNITAQSTQDSRSKKPMVGMVAGIVIFCLTCVVTIGVVLAFCINKTSSKQSIEFSNDGYNGYVKSASTPSIISKVNSRTPLTEHEENLVGVNNTNV